LPVVHEHYFDHDPAEFFPPRVPPPRWQPAKPAASI
jgi:hypothetical protein